MFGATNGSVFGGFGSTTQASPFGSTTLQPQPAVFGSGLFGSTTPFGGSIQPVWGPSSTPVFYSTGTPAFCATSTPFFGSTSTIFYWTGSPAFGSTPPGFGVFMGAQPLVFGSWVAFHPSVFGQSSSTPAFVNSATPAFGNVSSSTAFGAPYPTPATPSFIQSTSPFGNNNPVGSIGTPSFEGVHTTTPPSRHAFTTTPPSINAFGQPALGGQGRGSRVAPYTPQTESNASTSGGQAGKIESLSAMPVYKDKSHEELRWEDYQWGDKGSASSAGTGFVASVTPPIGQPSSTFTTSTSPNPQTTGSSLFPGQSSNPFLASTSPNPSAANSQPIIGSSPFPSQSSNSFQPASPFGVPSASAFTSPSSPSLFGTSSTQSAVSSTPSLFTTPTSSAGTVSLFGPSLFGNPQGSPFQSTRPSRGQTGGSLFGQTGGSLFGQTGSAFGQSTSPLTLFSNRTTTSTSHNPLAAKPQTIIESSPLFHSQSSNPVLSSSSATAFPGFSSPPPPPPLGTSTQSAFTSTPSLVTPTTSTGTVISFSVNNPQEGAFQSTTPSIAREPLLPVGIKEDGLSVGLDSPLNKEVGKEKEK